HVHETRSFQRQLSAKKERIPGVDHISTLFLKPTTEVACDIVGPIDAHFEQVCGNRPNLKLVFSPGTHLTDCVEDGTKANDPQEN
ncbi:MAG: hypothetical protein VX955_15260, partial [Pseudomonadota bacterium]|nr:hypothetical protein [Pseudomonadota bacterium]